MARARQNRDRGGSRRLVVAAALAGWCALIVVGAGRRADESTWLGTEHLDVLFMSVFGLVALLGLVMLVVLRPNNLEWSEPKQKRRNNIGIAMLAVLVLLWWRPSLLDSLVDDTEESEEVAAVAPEFDPEETDLTRQPVAQVSDLLGAAAIVALLAGVWYFSRREEYRPPAVDAVEDDEVGTTGQLEFAIEQAREHLATPGDPRAAVLAAYARLEAEFERHGLPRHPAETATEHVRRVLKDLPIDVEPVAQLGRLYELARFSNQPITVDDQQRAALALAAARTEPAAGT